MCLTLIAIGVLASASPQNGGSWTIQHQFDGEAIEDHFGTSAQGTSDIDGDGFADIISGAPYADPGGKQFAGSVYIFSGATGTLLFRLDGAQDFDQFGLSVAGAGDVNGDGYGDLIVGSPGADPAGQTNAGSAFVYAGPTGGLLYTFDNPANSSAYDEFGSSVAGAGDVNGDGRDDLIVGGSLASDGGPGERGIAVVYSGSSGGILFKFLGTADGDFLGNSVSTAGDVDADGFADLVVGAKYFNAGIVTNVGMARVFSGATGMILHEFHGAAASDELGYCVASAGDYDLDGHSDLLIGAPSADPAGRSLAGTAYVFSGLDGSLLLQINGGQDGDRAGWSVAALGDVTGDGIEDIIVGIQGYDRPGEPNVGAGDLYSGLTGELLHRFEGQYSEDLFGAQVGAAGDLDHDGRRELIVGATGADPNGRSAAGSVYVFGFNTFLTASALELSASTGGTIHYSLDFPASDAGIRYRLLGSATGEGPTTIGGLEVPLTNHDWLWDAMLRTSPPRVFRNAIGSLDQAGDSVITLTIPPGVATSYVGATFYFAAVTYIPSTYTGLKSSVAVPLTWLP